MSEPTAAVPAGTGPVPGISHTPSPHPVGDTVDRLAEAVRAAGATLFAIVDHSGEAERAGLSMRPTKLLIFGSPVAGTPVMVAAPLSAIDLPLKVLVWEDADGAVWMTHLDAGWLAGRHGIPPELAGPLAAPGKLAAGVAGRILGG
jgi:uncharacterized protein (DUF302 family)